MEQPLNIFDRDALAAFGGDEFGVNFVEGSRTLGAAHCHVFHELAVVAAGTGHYHDDSGDDEPRPGTLYWVPPRAVHHYISQNHLAVANFLWMPGVFPESLCRLPGWRLLNRTRLDDATLNTVLAIHRRLRREFDTRASGWRELALALFSDALVTLCRAAVDSRAETPGADGDWLKIEKAIRYLNCHYLEPVRRADAARQAGMSESQFYRKFKAVTGCDFAEYLLTLRLRHAAALLHTTRRPITEVALLSGFCDGNYFGARFRERFGETPRAYREKIIANH